MHRAEKHVFSHDPDALSLIHEYGRHHHREEEMRREERRVLDHRFDDQHDVEPVHLHEHAIHHSFEDESYYPGYFLQ